MKWILRVLLFLITIAPLEAQQPLGLNLNSEPGPLIPLDGVVIHNTHDGYLAISVPKEDVEKFALYIARTGLAIHGLGLLEAGLVESKKLYPHTNEAEVPLGACFLDTKEIFPRHKILDRNVQLEGTYTFVNVHGKTVTVPAYVGAPTLH